jgi:lambda family phage minor tail protein L
MPLPLSSIAIEEKNKLATDSVFMIALMVIVPGVTDPIRIVLNNSAEDITWRGKPWIAFNFEIEEIGETSRGEVPQVEVRIANVSRALEGFIQDYDSWVKLNGFSPMEIYIYALNSKNLASDDPEVEHYFELKKPKFDNRWAYFTLGAANPFQRRFPGGRIMKNHCTYRRFKGARCGYVGTETTCNRTLTQCRAYNNSTRFGGAPGVGKGGLVVAAG